MEKDKYYTPSIKEFYVGFEYEYYEQCLFYLPDKKTPIWINKVFGNEYEELDSVACNIEQVPPRIRIKYLDKEDIESLGFEIKFHNNSLLQYIYTLELKPDFSEGIELVYYPYYKRLVIQSDENHFHHGERVWYDGCCNNKSELKTLLKWLKIMD